MLHVERSAAAGSPVLDTPPGDEETDRRLYELEDYLKDHSFFRTSKTTIINLRRTKSIRPEIGARLLLTMDNQEKIIVSRQYAGSIKHALGVK